MVTNVSGTMIDGSTVGQEVGNELSRSDYLYMRKVFKRLNASYDPKKNEYKLNIQTTGTIATVELKEWRNKFWLNITGNPSSFMTGQNVVGKNNVSDLIRDMHNAVLLDIERKFNQTIGEHSSVPLFVKPLAIAQNIDDLNLKMNSLALTTYSDSLGIHKLDEIKKVFRVINHLYSHVISDQTVQTISQELEIRLTHWEGGCYLRFDKMSRTNRVWSLALYNKFYEQEDLEKDTTSAEWTKDRMRFDLTLHSEWFRQHRLTTLSVLDAKHGDDYKQWILSTIAQCFESLKLNYMATCKVSCKDVGVYGAEYKAWRKGDEMEFSQAALKWFLRRGLDLTLTAEFHNILGVVRSCLDLKGTDIREAIEMESLGKLGKKFEKGLTADSKALMLCSKISPILFSDYSTRNGFLTCKQTGEILKLGVKE